MHNKNGVPTYTSAKEASSCKYLVDVMKLDI